MPVNGNWGGKRDGAGRPPGRPNKVKHAILATRDISREVLKHIDIVPIWLGLLRSRREKIRLDAMTYLLDRAYGQAGSNASGRRHVAD